MTAKEKAYELFNNYIKVLGGINSADWVYFHGNEAKQCALITVEEVRFFHDSLFYATDGSIFDIYLNEVKQEIEKL